MPTQPAAQEPGTGAAVASAAALHDTLEALGVRFLFGMDAPAALHAVVAERGTIRAIATRDERSAAFMADGYAKVAGRPGVLGIGGVGATNAIQGVVESRLGSTPVVLLVEEGAGATRHRNELQDIDRVPMLAPVTKWAGQVEHPDRVVDLTAHAFRIATTGRPGPVSVGYPWDVLSAETAVRGPLPSEAVVPRDRAMPDPTAVERAAAAIRAASRPAIIAGGGVQISGAAEELERLARILGAPVATTPAGKGAFDERDALSAGVAGSYAGGAGGRGRLANEIVRRADVVLLVGTATGSGSTAERTVPDPGQTIVHLDVDPEEIGRNYPRSLPLVGDAALGLRALVDALAGDERTPWAGDLGGADDPPAPAATSGAIHPAAIIAALGAAIDDRAIVVADAGYGAAWALDRLRLRPPGRRFLSPSAYGTLGYGLPAALGAKLAAPGSTVVCVTGDGGIGFSLGELETAARCGIAVVVIVLNNSALAWSRHYDRHFYGYEGATRFADVDHAMVARGLGCDGVRVTAADDIADALAAAIASPGPTLIDAVTDPDARPPVDMFG